MMAMQTDQRRDSCGLLVDEQEGARYDGRNLSV